jgi:hypothetical protein
MDAHTRRQTQSSALADLSKSKRSKKNSNDSDSRNVTRHYFLCNLFSPAFGHL